MTAPFPVEKGIRQGCPLSGLLYSIAIEPLLHTLRRNLKNHCLQLPDSETSIALSAYADDVSIFITKDTGFNIVKKSLQSVQQIFCFCSKPAEISRFMGGSLDWQKRPTSEFPVEQSRSDVPRGKIGELS